MLPNWDATAMTRHVILASVQPQVPLHRRGTNLEPPVRKIKQKKAPKKHTHTAIQGFSAGWWLTQEEKEKKKSVFALKWIPN